MLKAQDRLKAAKIEQLAIVGWQDAGIMLQKRIGSNAVNLKLLEGRTADWREAFQANPEWGEAFAQLWGDLRREKLIWLDGHAKNIYFRLNEDTGQWVCGLLDQDMVGTFGDMMDRPFYLRRLSGLDDSGAVFIRSRMVEGNESLGDNPQEIMGKLLEQWGYLGFDREKKVLRDGLITVQQAGSGMRDLKFLPEGAKSPAVAPTPPTPASLSPQAPPPSLPPGGPQEKTAPYPAPQQPGRQGWLQPVIPPQGVNDHSPTKLREHRRAA